MRQKSLKDVRNSIRTRTHLWEGIKGNNFKNGDMSCEGCGQYKGTQPHVMVCKAYKDLKLLDFKHKGIYAIVIDFYTEKYSVAKVFKMLQYCGFILFAC